MIAGGVLHDLYTQYTPRNIMSHDDSTTVYSAHIPTDITGEEIGGLL